MNEHKATYLPLDVKTDRGKRYRTLAIVFSIIQLLVVIIHVIVTLALPARPGYGGFFGNVVINSDQTGLQFGFNIAISSLGVIESVFMLIAAVSASRGLNLVMVPFNIMFAILHFIGFVLWSLLAVSYGVFGLGIAVSIVCVFAFFATALIASNWLLLPTPIIVQVEQRELNFEQNNQNKPQNNQNQNKPQNNQNFED